jgi:hypothetical protein
MTLGRAPEQGDLWRSSAKYCDGKLSPTSIFSLLHRECHELFPDAAFADLFQDVGRRSVPPRIVSVVMVLQRLEGLSDREAVDRFAFDVRWKYAAGGLDLEYPSFVHTVLVDMRARLRESKEPDRIFRIVLDVAKSAGMVGRRRVLDSTPLYDAVATQDTVTMIRSAIRGLLRVADAELVAELRLVLRREDDYLAPGKPSCDWDDKPAREALVDALARDAHEAVAKLHGRKLDGAVREAAELLATVVGQDLEQTDDGVFRIARRVAKDRVISTVDPEARHGHKTSAHGFDGYKGGIAIDPDSEIITAAVVTPANVGDGSAAKELLHDVVPLAPEPATGDAANGTATEEAPVAPRAGGADAASMGVPIEVYGDSSYGSAEVLKHLEDAGVVANVKVQPPHAPGEGLFSQDAFKIDIASGTAQCPAGALVPLRRNKDDGWSAHFEPHCEACTQRPNCTTSKTGRSLKLHAEHERLSKAREHQRDAEWMRNYRATRPKIERKIGHLMRHRHGGRRARMRGRERVAQDFVMRCAAVNLSRLAKLELRSVVAATSTPPS